MSRSKIKNRIVPPSALMTAALLIITALAVLLSGCSSVPAGGDDSRHSLTTENDPAQTDSPPGTEEPPPKIIFTPPEDTALGSYDGYTFTVLERSGARDTLAADGDDRPESIRLLVGAKIKISSVTAPTAAVERAEQSGEAICDAMSLPLSDLSVLWRGGHLEDLAGIGLSPSGNGLSRVAAESLAVDGKYYIAFGDISPSSISAVYTLRCNLTAALSNEIYAIFGADIREATLAGELTLERFLRVIADSELIVSSTSCDTVLTIGDDDTEGAIDALFTALSGSVFDLSSDIGADAAREPAFAYVYGQVANIYEASETDGAAVFEITRFRGDTESDCSLPLPKLNETADYRCLADTVGTLGWAVPRGIPNGRRTADISTAIFDASYSRANEFFESVSKNASDTSVDLARLIFESRAFDAAYIYGWGDLAGMVCDGIMTGHTLGSVISDPTYAKQAEAAKTAIQIFKARLE